MIERRDVLFACTTFSDVNQACAGTAIKGWPGLITFARIPLLANSAVHVRTNERNAALVPP